jgi:hypothetical protein
MDSKEPRKASWQLKNAQLSIDCDDGAPLTEDKCRIVNLPVRMPAKTKGKLRSAYFSEGFQQESPIWVRIRQDGDDEDTHFCWWEVKKDIVIHRHEEKNDSDSD